MPKPAKRASTSLASAVDSDLSPWSTTSATSDPRRACSQSRASTASAVLSEPPDTATASLGSDSNGPRQSRRRANSAPLIGAVASAAAGGGLLTGDRLDDRRGRLGMPLDQLGEGLARALAVAHRGKGHAQFEQIVRRARGCLAIGAVVAGEHRCRRREILAEQVGLAEPVGGGRDSR